MLLITIKLVRAPDLTPFALHWRVFLLKLAFYLTVCLTVVFLIFAIIGKLYTVSEARGSQQQITSLPLQQYYYNTLPERLPPHQPGEYQLQ
jgi:hypothetical protein